MATRRSMKWSKAAALLTAGAFVLSACGSSGGRDASEEIEGKSWDAIIADARSEGEVVVYNNYDQEMVTRVATEFNKIYPEIKVTSEKGNQDMFATLDAQIATGTDGADLFMNTLPFWFEKHEADLLPAVGPNADSVPDGRWVIEGSVPNLIAAPYSVFVWNTDAVNQPIEKWDDFLRPDLKGKIAFKGDVNVSGADFLSFLTDELGEGYLEALGNQNLKMYQSGGTATQAVAAGEVVATMMSVPSLLMSLQKSGAHIDYRFPENGFALEMSVGALKAAKHPNAALVFNDFLLSKEGQAAMVGDGVGAAVLEGIPNSVEVASSYRMHDSAPYDSAELAKWQGVADRYLAK